MIKADYTHHTSPTHFTKKVAGVEKPVKVDLIGGQYVGTEPTIRISELGISALRGIDLAFEVAREGYDILKAKFATLKSVGPSWAAQVAQEQGEDFEHSQRSAYEYARALVDAIERTG